MPNPTPTADDALRKEAVDLSTDVTSLLVNRKDLLRPEDAYLMAMECVRMADRILRARQAALPHAAREFFLEARTAAQRTLVALEREGARHPHLEREMAPLYRRLHLLALTLGELGSKEDPS